MTKKEEKAIIHDIHEKHYGSKKQKKQTRGIELTRNAMMLQAKERGIKNFRILSKEELTKVLDTSTRPEDRDQLIKDAVARWHSGWGKRGTKTN